MSITSIHDPLIGVVDLVGQLDGVLTVIDFKTAKAGYPGHEVILADELTTYQLAEPDAEQVAFCVLVKTKEPRIDWHISRREGGNLSAYLAKVAHIAREIEAHHFYQPSGRWCGYCDFLSVPTPGYFARHGRYGPCRPKYGSAHATHGAAAAMLDLTTRTSTPATRC